MTTKIAGDRKKLFHLREYDAAFLKVFSRVIHLRAEEAYPLLKEIPNGAAPSHPHVTGHRCRQPRQRQGHQQGGSVSAAHRR